MADISDVETALVGLVAGVVYPSGTAQPSVTGAEVQIFRGWPEAEALDRTLKQGNACVSVFSQGRGMRNTTRYPQAWRILDLSTPTLTAVAAGPTVIIGGTGGVGQNIGIALDRIGYVYPAQATDTPTTVAAALAALVPGASSSGATVTCLGTPSALVGSTGTAIRELRRQQQVVMVTCWCPTPQSRDTLAAAVDAALAATDFLALTDGQQARVQFHDTAVSDQSENADLYRRDLAYLVEYATTQTQAAATLLFGHGTLTPPGLDFGDAPPATAVITDGQNDVEVSPAGNLIGV